MPRKRTPVVIGTTAPFITIVVSPTVKGLNAFWVGTLMPFGPLGPTVGKGVPSIPLIPWNGSGVNGTAASDELKNERAYLKSANTVRYLSHRSRVNDP